MVDKRTFVVNPPPSVGRANEVRGPTITPRQAAFIENPPPGTRIVIRKRVRHGVSLPWWAQSLLAKGLWNVPVKVEAPGTPTEEKVKEFEGQWDTSTAAMKRFGDYSVPDTFVVAYKDTESARPQSRPSGFSTSLAAMKRFGDYATPDFVVVNEVGGASPSDTQPLEASTNIPTPKTATPVTIVTSPVTGQALDIRLNVGNVEEVEWPKEERWTEVISDTVRTHPRAIARSLIGAKPPLFEQLVSEGHIKEVEAPPGWGEPVTEKRVKEFLEWTSPPVLADTKELWQMHPAVAARAGTTLSPGVREHVEEEVLVDVLKQMREDVERGDVWATIGTAWTESLLGGHDELREKYVERLEALEPTITELEEERKSLEEKAALLKAKAQLLEEQRTELLEKRRSISPTNIEAVEAFNDEVSLYNLQVAQTQEEIAELNEKVREFNLRAGAVSNRIEKYKERIELAEPIGWEDASNKWAYGAGRALGIGTKVSAAVLGGTVGGYYLAGSSTGLGALSWLGGESVGAQATRGLLKGAFLGSVGARTLTGAESGKHPVDIAFDVGGDIAAFYGFGWGMKQGLSQRPLYEVTYTWGRAKGVIHTPESSKIFDVSAVERQLVPELPRQELYETLRIRSAITPTKEGIVAVGAKYYSPAGVYVPSESKITIQEVALTEFGKPIDWAVYTARKPNTLDKGMLRFSLADYGEAKAAEYVVRSLAPRFYVPKATRLERLDWTPVIGKIDVVIPVKYSAEDFRVSPISTFFGDILSKSLTPGMSGDAEYLQLVKKALKSVGTKVVASVKPATTPTPPTEVGAVEALGGLNELEKVESPKGTRVKAVEGVEPTESGTLQGMLVTGETAEVEPAKSFNRRSVEQLSEDLEKTYSSISGQVEREKVVAEYRERTLPEFRRAVSTLTYYAPVEAERTRKVWQEVRVPAEIQKMWFPVNYKIKFLEFEKVSSTEILELAPTKVKVPAPEVITTLIPVPGMARTSISVKPLETGFPLFRIPHGVSGGGLGRWSVRRAWLKYYKPVRFDFKLPEEKLDFKVKFPEFKLPRW